DEFLFYNVNGNGAKAVAGHGRGTSLIVSSAKYHPAGPGRERCRKADTAQRRAHAGGGAAPSAWRWRWFRCRRAADPDRACGAPSAPDGCGPGHLLSIAASAAGRLPAAWYAARPPH